MSRPRQDETSEAHIGPGLEALQSVPFDQVMAELAEAVCRLIVAKARSGDHAKPNVGKARAVTVATLEAEIDRPTDDQGKQLRIRMQARRPELGQNIQRREGYRVAHQRQLYQVLDRAAPELRPDPLVFASRFLVCRMRRPVDAQMSEVIEPYGNGAAALIEGRVQVDAQAGDGGSLQRIRGAGRQCRQALLGFRERTRQELAFGPVQLQLEDELVLALPAILHQHCRAGIE